MAQPGRLRHEDVVAYLNRRLGTTYTRGAYTAWENGRAAPPQEVVDALADAWGISPTWLRYGDGEEPKRILRERESQYGEAEGFERVAYLGALPCGPWEEPAVERTILIKRGLGGPGRFVFRVSGNSMAPRLNDGDYVVAETATTAAPGDIVVALTQDGEMTVKRLEVGTGGRLVLRSLNPDARPVEPKASQIRGRVLMIVPEGAVPEALLP